MEWLLLAAAMFAAGYSLALWRHGHTAHRIDRLVQAERDRTRQIYTAAAKRLGVDVASLDWLQAVRSEEGRLDGYG